MRKIARNKLRFERSGHTFDTTALVHEAYFRLIDQNDVEWQSRAHFLAIAAQAMRRILLNYAEYKNAEKRGGSFSKIDMDMEQIPGKQNTMDDETAESILALNKALNKMEKFNERGCRVVEYHFFGGLTWKEISEVMGVAPVTVRRAWNVSKLWLNRELNGNVF
jgi:RNA polymerase sigma factor (TIGR02999 family)